MARYDKQNRKKAKQEGSAAVVSAALSSTGQNRPLSSAVPMRPQERLRSMDQERAEFALGKIQEITSAPDNVQIEVRRYLNGLPALIRMNGLGQALAFYRMQGEGSSHELIYRLVGSWLCTPGSKGRVFEQGEGDVLAAITRSDVHAYMAAQNEALALLEWLKKFGLALLKKEER